MKIDEWTSEDVHTSGGGEFPPCAGLTFNVLPEAQSTVSAESSQTGVSTRNAQHVRKPSSITVTTSAQRLTLQMTMPTLRSMMPTYRTASSSLMNTVAVRRCLISSMANSLMKRQVYTITVQGT